MVVVADVMDDDDETIMGMDAAVSQKSSSLSIDVVVAT